MKFIKTQLEGAKGIWPNELPNVLWAYKMTIRTPTRETPFKLTFRSDEVILVEVGLTSYRVAHYNNEENEKQLRLSLNLMDEVRMNVEQRVACYKSLMSKHRCTGEAKTVQHWGSHLKKDVPGYKGSHSWKVKA